MIGDIVDGVVSYFKVLPLIRRYKLWIYLVITGLISLLIGLCILYGTIKYSSDLGSWFESLYGWDFGKEFFSNVSQWLAVIAIVAFSLIIYKYLVIIAVAPFMSLCSEKIENGLLGGDASIEFSLKRAIKEMVRGIRIALRNIVRELIYTALLLIAGLFPFFALISAPAILVVQAYYAGFGNMDFYLERHANVRQSVHFVRRHRGLAIGNGAIYLVILLIPIIGLFFAPTLGTAAGTLESMKRMH